MEGWTVDEEKPVRGAGGGLTNKYPFKGTPVPVNPSPPPSERRPKPHVKRSWLMELSVLFEDTMRAQNRRHALDQIALAVIVLAVVVGLSVGIGWGMR